MIRFFTGMWNAPGAVAFRESWREDTFYRWFVRGSITLFILQIALFAYFT